MDRIAVLIPCYNEAATIAKVVADFRRVLPENSRIYVYDNNSSDGTDQIAREAGATVRYERRQGKGNVIRRMFREIDAACYLLVDGDDTYPAEAAPALIAPILEGGCDMAVGDRLSSTYLEENKRPLHGLGNLLIRFGINTLFRAEIRDILTGYRAFSHSFVKSFPVLSDGFEIETEMSIHAVEHRMAIANVVIDYRDRPDGSVSKLNTASDGLRVLKMIARLYRLYHPLPYYGFFALLLTAAALVLFVPVFIEYLRTGLVPRFPTLIVCGFLAVAAIQFFFSGMILGTIVQKSKQEFEINLLRTGKAVETHSEEDAP